MLTYILGIYMLAGMLKTSNPCKETSYFVLTIQFSYEQAGASANKGSYFTHTFL